MAIGVELEAAAALRPVDCPASEDARHLGHVGLRVAAIDAQRVQLHQLARVVFIQALRRLALVHSAARNRPSSRARRAERIRADALGVVEIEQHGRAVRHGFKQVFKFAQRVRANHVALVADEVVRHLLVLAQVDVEVIEPEVGHHFLQAARWSRCRA